VDEAGCFNDTHILNELLKIAKKEAGLVAIQLDVSKAFDTVAHEATADALRSKGIPKSINGSYEGVTTNIKQGTLEVGSAGSSREAISPPCYSTPYWSP
jgi:hypothetical protein